MSYYLGPNEGERTPSSILCVDVLTQPVPAKHKPGVSVHVFARGAVRWARLVKGELTRRGHQDCGSPDEFWDTIKDRLSPERTTWIFALNLGRVIASSRWWERKENKEYVFTDPSWTGKTDGGEKRDRKRTGLFVSADPPNLIGCWHRESGASVKMIDLRNYIDADIEELASWVECEPSQDDWDLVIGESIVGRLLWRVEILERCVVKVIRWVKDERLGNFRPTISSQSMASWRHGFLPPNLVIHTGLNEKRFERKAVVNAKQLCYWIGRVLEPGRDWFGRPGRCYPPGERVGPVVCYDVRSQYPCVMKANLYPRERIAITEDEPVHQVEGKLRSLGALALVSVATDREPLPYRHPKTGRVWWVTGEFNTHLCGLELLWAIRSGFVKRVWRCHWYSLADLFSGWVNHWWGRRQEAVAAGDAVKAALVKRLLLGLHGKLGQRSFPWQTLPDITAPLPWGAYLTHNGQTGQTATRRAVGWECQQQGERDETEQGCPHILAFILANARMNMRGAVLVAGASSVLWEDCDQLLVDSAGAERLEAKPGVVGTGLGQLRREWSEDFGVIRGLHHYQLGRSVMTPGVSPVAQVVVDGWSQEEWSHMDQDISRNPPLPGPTVETVHRSIPTAALPGVLAADGTVRPYHVSEVPNG